MQITSAPKPASASLAIRRYANRKKRTLALRAEINHSSSYRWQKAWR
jgi:hypothetical protein